MGKSVKLTDGSYIDAEGVYDATQGKTQTAINASLVKNANKFALTHINRYVVAYLDNKIQIISTLSDGTGNQYGIDFYLTTKRIAMWFYDASKGTYTILWNFT